MCIASMLFVSNGAVLAASEDSNTMEIVAEYTNEKQITYVEDRISYHQPSVKGRMDNSGDLEEEALSQLYENAEKYNLDPTACEKLIKEDFSDNRVATYNVVENNKAARLGEWILMSRVWSVEPAIDTTEYMVTYSVPWIVADNYQCPSPVSLNTGKSVSSSVDLGFTASGNLTSDEALEFGLEVTASRTVTNTATFNVGMEIPGWTIKAQRSFIRWTRDTYKGYCTCYYMTTSGQTMKQSGWAYATNIYDRAYGPKFWERYNDAETATAIPPQPPVNWEP